LIYSSLVGGSGNECISGIDINSSNEVFFVGATNTSGLTCTQNAFYTYSIGGYDILLGKVNPSGDTLLYLSYYGGKNNENASVGEGWIYYTGKISLSVAIL